MKRLAVLLSHPVQYLAPLMRHLSAEPDIDLTVYYCSRMGVDVARDAEFGRSFQWDIPLLEGYRHIFLSALGGDKGVRSMLQPFNPAIVAELRRNRFDALLVHGYASATNLLAIAAARSVGTRILFRAEMRERRGSPPKRLVKRAALSLFFRTLIDACLYIGTASQAVYQRLGVPPERLHFTPYCVDNDFFQREARQQRPMRDQLRARFGVPDDRVLIMSVGKLIPVKRPLVLLRAFEIVRRKSEASLVFVGDGYLRSQIERAIQEAGIPDVFLAGFLNQSKIAQAYAAADLLVLPSASETWGLTVNEAMNFALPVIVSDQVGCAPDLVEDSRNGFIVPSDNPEALADAIMTLVDNPKKRAAFGRRSAQIIENWSSQSASAAIAKAVTLVAARNERPVVAARP